MGTKERRDRERSETRQRILDVAREMFAQEGFDAVSMRRIADRIEYSPTAIYLHFKDKEELIQELCENDFYSFSMRFATVNSIEDPQERLRAAGQAYVDFALEHPNQYRLMFMTPHPAFDPQTKDVEHGNPESDAYAFLVHTVTEGLKSKRFRRGMTDVQLIAQTVWAGIHGVIALHIAKSHDPWVNWRAVKRRVEVMNDVLIFGLTKN